MRKTWLFILIILLVPLTSQAFWFFNKAKTEPVAKTEEMTASEKKIADSKYEIWKKSFDKADVDEVIKNKNQFVFSEEELNYLFNSEGAKAKKPLLTDFKVIIDNDILKVDANFKKIISGRVYFESKLVVKDKKANFAIQKVKYLGVRLPVAWGNKLLNREIDKYFSFLYNDKRYKDLKINIDGKVVTIAPEFK